MGACFLIGALSRFLWRRLWLQYWVLHWRLRGHCVCGDGLSLTRYTSLMPLRLIGSVAILLHLEVVLVVLKSARNYGAWVSNQIKARAFGKAKGQNMCHRVS